MLIADIGGRVGDVVVVGGSGEVGVIVAGVAVRLACRRCRYISLICCRLVCFVVGLGDGVAVHVGELVVFGVVGVVVVREGVVFVVGSLIASDLSKSLMYCRIAGVSR